MTAKHEIAQPITLVWDMQVAFLRSLKHKHGEEMVFQKLTYYVLTAVTFQKNNKLLCVLSIFNDKKNFQCWKDIFSAISQIIISSKGGQVCFL